MTTLDKMAIWILFALTVVLCVSLYTGALGLGVSGNIVVSILIAVIVVGGLCRKYDREWNDGGW